MILIKQYFEYLTGKNAKSLPEWATYVDFLNKQLPPKKRLKFENYKTIPALSNAILDNLVVTKTCTNAGVFNFKGVVAIELSLLTWELPKAPATRLPINVDYTLKINGKQLAEFPQSWTLSSGKTASDSLHLLEEMHNVIGHFNQSFSNNGTSEFETPEQVYAAIRNYVYPVGEHKMPIALEKVFEEWKSYGYNAVQSMLHISRQYLRYLSEMTAIDGNCKGFSRWINENIQVFLAGIQMYANEPTFVRAEHLELNDYFNSLFAKINSK